jgi:hypothetical protein
MKYLNQLNYELSDLTKRLGGEIFDAPPSKKGNRARTLQSLTYLLNKVRVLDCATADWSDENATQWFIYLNQLEAWLNNFPKIPEDLEH